MRYEPGIRWRTGDPAATGWPRSETTQWPPALAPGREDGTGWPGAEEHSRPRHPREGRPGSGRRPAPPRRPPSGAWRTYLLVGTLLVLVAAGTGGALLRSGWLTPPPQTRQAPQAAPTAAATAGASRPAAAQPTPTPRPVAVVDKGAGSFVAAGSEGPLLGAAGVLRRFRVEVESGINEDPDAFGSGVDRILGDQRSWIGGGQFRLQRVPRSAPAEFTIFLASPVTSEAMCAAGGLHTDRFTSCRLAGQVIINDARWQTAVPDYGAPLEVYQAYAINHEVGHQLGQGHEACTGAGRPAPVMQQQTLGLKGCVANSWPFLAGQRYAGPPIP